MGNMIHNKWLWRHKGEFRLLCILPITSDIDYLHFDYSSSPATVISQDELFCSTLNWMLSNAAPLQGGLNFLKISYRREWSGSVGIATNPQRPDHLRGPPSILSIVYRGLFPRWSSGRGVKLTIHLHLVSKSKIVELYLHSPYVFTFIGEMDEMNNRPHVKKSNVISISLSGHAQNLNTYQPVN
jgi:hypothetical protein